MGANVRRYGALEGKVVVVHGVQSGTLGRRRRSNLVIWWKCGYYLGNEPSLVSGSGFLGECLFGGVDDSGVFLIVKAIGHV